MMNTGHHRRQLIVLGSEERWRFRATDSVIVPPATTNGSLFVGSLDGQFYALDAQTGQKHWQVKLEGYPAVSFHDRQPRPLARKRWRRDLCDRSCTQRMLWNIGLPSAQLRTVVADDDLLCFVSGGQLYALNPQNGAVMWT